MAKGNGVGPVSGPAAGIVLAIGLGRGFGGKSTGLAELVWRARNAGRDVIVADGDPRSRTLAGMFEGAAHPLTEELPDVKAWLTAVLTAYDHDGGRACTLPPVWVAPAALRPPSRRGAPS